MILIASDSVTLNLLNKVGIADLVVIAVLHLIRI